MIHIDRISREKANGASVQVGVHPSKVSDVQCDVLHVHIYW